MRGSIDMGTPGIRMRDLQHSLEHFPVAWSPLHRGKSRLFVLSPRGTGAPMPPHPEMGKPPGMIRTARRSVVDA